MGMDSHCERAGLEDPFNTNHSVFLSFSKPQSCFQHLEFRVKGGDGF